MNKFIALIAVLVMTFTMSMGISSASAKPDKPKNLVCQSSKEPYTGTYKKVTVPAGASCYLEGATVLGGIHSKDAKNVYIIDTEVAHNIHIMGTTNDTVIGTKGCTYDPHAGNNIHVQKSHNVAICWESVDNNIQIFQNDGRITLVHNTAGNNIMVQNNYAYVHKDGDGQHKKIGAIRFRHNVAGNHNVVKHNSGRLVLAGDNTPAV